MREEKTQNQPLPQESTPIKVDANLASFAYFAPRSKRRYENRTVRLPSIKNKKGKYIPRRITVSPSVQLGEPTTQDQDFFYAFMEIALQQKRRQGGTRGSDSKGARAHAKGHLSVFLASLDLPTSFSQGTIRRHECFGASHNRYPKLGLSNQRTTTERDHGASIDLLRRRVGQIEVLPILWTGKRQN